MKAKLEIETSKVRKYGPAGVVALAYVQASYEPVSNSDMSKFLGVTFPTAQKILKRLEDDGLIKESGKGYVKI